MLERLGFGVGLALVLGALVSVPTSAGAQEPEGTPPEPPQSQEALRTRALLELDSLSARLAENPSSRADRLERLRTLYFLSVDDERRLSQAEYDIQQLQVGPDVPSDVVAIASAYQAALEVVRGKHAFWPGSKWGHVQDGLKVLDSLVAAHPDEPEVRYLRLASVYYLPFFFRRGGTADEDLAHLADLLPRTSGYLSPAAFARVRSFVLETADLTPEQRTALEGSDAPRRSGQGTTPP